MTRTTSTIRKGLVGLFVLLITMLCINITAFARSDRDLEAWWGESDPFVARCTDMQLSDKGVYEFRLYRGSSVIAEEETRYNHVNFEADLRKSGVRRRDNVYFKVRVVERRWKSDWAKSEYLTDDDWDIVMWDEDHKYDYCDDYDDYYWNEDHRHDYCDDDWYWDGPAYVNPDGWFRETDGGWYFYINRTKQHGWISDPARGCWYYCDRDSGRMKTGWQYINGYWYYLKPDYPDQGRMITGWLQEPGGWYYLDPYTDPVGRRVTNDWRQINGYWYYFGNDGFAFTGEHYINGSWYYFFTSNYYGRPECSMATNVNINGHYYDANGRRVY